VRLVIGEERRCVRNEDLQVARTSRTWCSLNLVAAPESYGGYSAEPVARDHVSLLSVLRRRALIIVVVALLTGGAAAAFAITRGDTYQSTSKLLFAQSIGPELQALGLIPGTPGDADNISLSNKDVVGSHQVAVETARRLTAAGWKRTAEQVSDDLKIQTERDTDVVEITASVDNADRSAQLSATYADVAAEAAQDAQRNQARRALGIVETQLAGAPQQGQMTNNLRDQAAKLRTLATVGTGSPRIIQRGFKPESASGNMIQTIVLGAAFGLLLGIGLALVREQSDHKLRRASQVTEAIGAPVLTTVPRSRALKRHKPFADLPPQVAEAFRMLQMNLRFAREDPVRSVMVTSARTGDGKTTVSWNLAAAAASGGMSVALIEADLRRPSMADRYGLDHGPGLTDVLQGDFSIAEVTQARGQAPQLVGHPSALDVIVAGSPASNPWALIQSSVMARVLDVLRREHDLIVIDTPPLPHVSDAISLLPHVDGALITVSVGSTRSHDAGRLRDQLEGLDANVLGVVANGGSAMSGYAAYARTPVAPPEDPSSRNGHPGAPLVLGDRAEPPTS
jgi:polysaccharide biosynthesis transport protein